MRKLIAVALAGALLATLSGAAVAAKKKPIKVHETFGATLAPFPKNATAGDPAGLTKPGCSAGQEDVHWTQVEFKAPGKGTLRFWMEGFTGDHDIYVFDGDLLILRGDQEQVGPTLAPPEEEVSMPLKKGQVVQLVACNWAGQPEVEAHYEGTFK